MQQNNDLQRILNYAYFYLKFRPRSRYEMEKYLHEKGKRYSWTEEHIDMAIQDLIESNYINDASFIEWFVEQRNAHKPKSEFVLRQELSKYRIDKTLIEKYFQEHTISEEALALQALSAKWHRFESLEHKKRYEKATNYLARRGFSYEIIKKTIAQIDKKE